MRQIGSAFSGTWDTIWGEPLPDHSSLTRIRERYGVDVFRRFFEKIVEQCQEVGLVWGKELYIDATKVEANASLDSLTPRFAVEAHLANVFAEEAVALTEQQMAQEQATASEPGEQAEGEVPMQLPVSLSQEDREALCQHDEERYDWLEHLGAQDRSVSIPWYQRVADLRMSTTDPDASLMLTKNGSHLGYQTHYVVDGGKSRIILGVLVAPSEVSENKPMLDLLWRARFRWKLWPRQATGDRKYGTEENLVAIESQHLHAYIPSPDNDHHTAFFSSQEFQYNAERDVYRCPNDELLRLSKVAYTEHEKRYQGDAATCNACPLKPQCTESRHGRLLTRSFDEEYLERVRAYHGTPSYQKAMGKRSMWVEPLFAEGKDWHGMRRFRLRRLWRVNCEALMRAAGQNLKRLLKKRGWGRRPWPEGAADAACSLLFGLLLLLCQSLEASLLG